MGRKREVLRINDMRQRNKMMEKEGEIEKVYKIIDEHIKTLKPIRVLLVMNELPRVKFYKHVAENKELGELYKKAQEQVTWIRNEIQKRNLEISMAKVGHGKAKHIQTRTRRDGDGNIIETETIEIIKAPSESAIKFLLERIDARSPTSAEGRIFGIEAMINDEPEEGQESLSRERKWIVVCREETLKQNEQTDEDIS